MIGQTLRQFRITEKLGEGGMGEVYRAEDTRLGREVAVKILPDAFVADPERLARFEREARALASLSHPSVAAIHEVGEEDGTHFLVMELVDGESLADRLGRGPLPVAEALGGAVQIAEALEAAHGQGIVHRDLKPANVMVDREGRVKLLDFGLARVLATGGETPDLTRSPTLSYQPTVAGTILGTAPYMSPEQARGQPAGEQADIWALGCVLYEMLSGHRAFEGATVTDVMAAIVEREPDWEALPPETPPLARSALRRCLRKDPKRRFHDVADVRIELEDAQRGGVAPVAAAGPARRRLSLPLAGAAVALVLLLALGGLAWWALAGREADPSMGPARFHLQPPPGVEVINPTGERPGVEPALAISRDGRRVAFRGWDRQGEPRLYVRSIDEPEARPVPGTEGGYNPFFSPDGEWLGFFSRGAVRKVALAGGRPRSLFEAAKLRGAAWGEDGTIVLGGQRGLVRISAEGGEGERLTEVDEESFVVDHYWPHLLPGGGRILFQVHGGIGERHHGIALLSLVTGEERTLVRGASYPRYARGHVVFSRLGTLHGVPFDASRSRLLGEARPVLDDVFFAPGSYRVAYDLAATGALVYSPGAPGLEESRILQVDRDGSWSVLSDRRAPYRLGGFPLSPDARRLAIVIPTALEEMGLWVYDLGRDTWTGLVADANYKSNPVWTPDGRSIVFSDYRNGAAKLFRIRVDGSGALEQLTTGSDWDYAHAVSPDGRFVLFERGPYDFDLYTVDLEAGGPAEPWLATPANERTATFSPDGRWVTYESHRSGGWEVYARPFPGPGAPVRVSSEGGPPESGGSVGGPGPRWSPAGGEIFYRCGDALCAVTVETGDELVVGRERILFELPPGTTEAFTFEVAPGGRHFYMLQSIQADATERRIVYAPRWTDELKN